MKVTPEDLRAANLPVSEAALCREMIAAVRQQVPLTSASDFRASLTAPEDSGIQTIISGLTDVHAFAEDDVRGFLNVICALGNNLYMYNQLNPAGAHLVAAQQLDMTLYKAYLLASENVDKFDEYVKKVKELGEELDRKHAKVKSNWGKAKGALSDKQKDAIEAARTARNTDFVVRTVSRITNVGGGTTTEMPLDKDNDKNPNGRGLLKLFNLDYQRDNPTGDRNYWLELVDPRHRSWGHEMENQYTDWLSADTHLNFWDWLTKMKNADTIPSVHYLDPSQRWRYKLTFDSGNVLYPLDSGALKPFSTKRFETHFSGNGFAIWVCDSKGNFYAGNHQVSVFHHSSFMAGNAVFAAGEMAAANGKIIFISQKTGHYQTPSFRLFDTIRILSRLTDVSELLVEVWNTQGKLRYCYGKDVLTTISSADSNKLLGAKEFAAAYESLKQRRLVTVFYGKDEHGAEIEDRDEMLKVVRAQLATDSSDLPPPSKPPPVAATTAIKT